MTRLFWLTPRFKFLPMTMKQGSAILIVKLERNIKMTTGEKAMEGVRKVESWEDEVIKAVITGEREFGLLDAHQTVKHSLTRRCEEILLERPQSNLVEEHRGLRAEGDLL